MQTAQKPPQPGEVTREQSPGLASNKGFLFIDRLGRVGAFDENGVIHWDIVAMVLGFEISTYVNGISGQGFWGNPQQQIKTKLPGYFQECFVFPAAGVLMGICWLLIFSRPCKRLLFPANRCRKTAKLGSGGSEMMITKDEAFFWTSTF